MNPIIANTHRTHSKSTARAMSIEMQLFDLLRNVDYYLPTKTADELAKVTEMVSTLRDSFAAAKIVYAGGGKVEDALAHIERAIAAEIRKRK